MALNAQATVRRAVEILQDTTSVRWPLNEIVRWLNDGQREIILYRPDAMVTNQTLSCVAGTRQSIANLTPPGAKLIEVPRNNSAASKRAVRDINREVLDASSPGWHALPGSTEILHFMFDERDPRTFYVYPPAAGASAQVDVVYSALPTDIVEPALGASLPAASAADLNCAFTGVIAVTTGILTASSVTAGVLASGQLLTGGTTPAGTTITAQLTGTAGGAGTYQTSIVTAVASTPMTAGPAAITGSLSVPDIFANTLLDYMLYRAYSKDSEYAGNGARAQSHYGYFATALGIEVKATQMVSPNVSQVSAKNPNNPMRAGASN